MADSDVKAVNIQTTQNFNLEGSEANVVKELKKTDLALAEAVKDHILSMENKRKVTAGLENQATVNGRERSAKL